MPADPEPVAALAYQNRRGETYYLHVTTTKNGKPRYRGAKSIGPGALASMPEGYEFSESVNGVVSVRRVLAASECAPAADLALVQAELARHPHLRRHHVRDEKGELVVYEPVGRSQRYDAVMKFVPQRGRAYGPVRGLPVALLGLRELVHDLRRRASGHGSPLRPRDRNRSLLRADVAHQPLPVVGSMNSISSLGCAPSGPTGPTG